MLLRPQQLSYCLCRAAPFLPLSSATLPGDMHFSQGDGEVSFCGAIEMNGFVEMKCEIMRGGVKQYLTPCGPTPLHVHPIFEIGPLEPRFSEWLVFEGISVDETGKQHYLDASVAYKRAVLACIDYLSKFGYTKEQARGRTRCACAVPCRTIKALPRERWPP